VRAIAAQINTGSPETVEPLIRELYTRLDGVSSQLREVDRKISPSFVRRFFEKVRPQDEKIAFYLLRFYFSQQDVDEDVIDKVDFLATVAATGRSDPDAGATRPRAQIKKLFEALTSASIWPRLDTAMTPAIVRAFDELATDVAAAREFEELLTQRLLENVRTMKRRVSHGLSHPDILTAVAWCNLTTRSVFHRLYEKEERRLDEMTGRITDLERELSREGDDTPPDEFRRFRDSRIRFDRQAMDRNLRAQHVVELKQAIGEVLQKFDISGLAAEDIDDALELVEEIDPEGKDEDSFWKPCLERISAAVELYDDGAGPLRTNITGLAHLKLEPWELAAARRAISTDTSPSDVDRLLLKAAALRIKAEVEADSLRTQTKEGAPPELVRAARATLSRGAQLDRQLIQIVDSMEGGSGQEVRWWTRSRFRLVRATSDLWLSLDSAQVKGSGSTSAS